MKNLLFLGAALSVLITSDMAIANTVPQGTIAPAVHTQLQAQSQRQASPVLRPAAFRPRISAGPSPDEPSPHSLLLVAIGLLALRMRATHTNEKFAH